MACITGLESQGRFFLVFKIDCGIQASMTCRNLACQSDQQLFTSDEWKKEVQSMASSISLAQSKLANVYLQIFLPLLLGLHFGLTAVVNAREMPSLKEEKQFHKKLSYQVNYN